jgi:integrase
MASRRRIGLRDIRNLTPGQVIWDASVSGFGARRQKGAAVSYMVFYRTQEGRQRWHTIGRHGAPWTPDTAREEARRLLGDVARGDDPASTKRSKRQAKTVAELCDLYLADAEAGRLLTRRKVPKKASTLKIDRFRIECHVKPLLGRLSVAAVTREDVDQFMHDVAERKSVMGKSDNRASGGRGAATRTVGMLGAIFGYAVKNRMRADNPVRGVDRFADGERNRRLSDNEYTLLSLALERAAAAAIWPPAIAAVRFLALTGWRSGEALALRWTDLNVAGRTAILPDTKTGRSTRPLSTAACEVVSSLPRISELVFPPTRAKGTMATFGNFWTKIAALGGLPKDITPHTLRHSFASLAGDLGYSEPTIGALIGHKGQTITSRYVHTADAVLVAASDVVANETLARMGKGGPETITAAGA